MKPEVSVIMSTYCRNHEDDNGNNLLRRAIESILNQTFENFELVNK